MATVGYDRVVVGMDVPVIVIIRAPAVVEVRLGCTSTARLQGTEIAGGHYHAKIP